MDLLVSILIAHMLIGCSVLAAFREYHLTKQSVCAEDYGTVLVDVEVASFLSCAIGCLNVPESVSCVYNPKERRCKVNNETWPNPPVTGCDDFVEYFVQGPLQPQCSPGNSCTDPLNNIRLCEGGGSGVCDTTEGRIEILRDGIWGSICDDYWNDFDYVYPGSVYMFGVRNAGVACRMLGYTSGTAIVANTYGEGSVPYMMDNVACEGTELSLLDCPYDGWGIHDCGTHAQAVGVQCV